MPASVTVLASVTATASKVSLSTVKPEVKGLTSGEKLRLLRKTNNLTLRDVARYAKRIADRQENEEFAVSPGRLSEIETKGVVPSIYRLYSLALIYKIDYREMLSWFGIPQLP